MSAISIYRFAAVSVLLLLCLSSLALAVPLQGTEWKPLRINDLPVPEESSAFIQFHSKGRLNGHSGCNRLFAEYSVVDKAIFIGPVAATRMACADSVMERERSLATALESARTYKREGAQLVLFDSDGRPILELRQTDWD